MGAAGPAGATEGRKRPRVLLAGPAPRNVRVHEDPAHGKARARKNRTRTKPDTKKTYETGSLRRYYPDQVPGSPSGPTTAVQPLSPTVNVGTSGC